MPSFSMGAKFGGSLANLHKNNSPGPGNYESDLKHKHSAPGYGFGTSKRGSEIKEKAPGPGAYKVPVKIADVPSYAMPNKKEEHKFV